VTRMTAKVSARVDQVYDMIVAGLSYRQILKLANEKYGWGVSPRSVDYYIAKAKERFEQEAKVHRGVELGKALARLDNQYFKADTRKDHRGAAAIVEKAADLMSLKVGRDDDAARSALRELMERLRDEAR
jgi:hypothetical protein